MKYIRDFLCKIGLHQKESTKFQVVATGRNGNKKVDLYYYVCCNCGDGSPLNEDD